jgi:hypothetical protein
VPPRAVPLSMIPDPGPRGRRKERTSVLKGSELNSKKNLTVLILCAAMAVGCGGSDEASATGDQGPMPAAARPMSEEVQALVSEGNEAQRAGAFDQALTAYRAAMELDSEHPVPQFGALMVAMATGNEALSDSLTQLLQTSAPELVSMLSPEGSMGGGMPADPHGGDMPGGMPGGAPPLPEGMPPIGDLPQGHPSLNEVGPADSTQPDTTGGEF